MKIEEYFGILEDFHGGQFASLSENYDSICLAQDELIKCLQSAGANIKAWKVVKEDGLFIISPIFDFQIFNSLDEHFTNQHVTGFEVELCYQAGVPEGKQQVDQIVNKSQPRAAIEIMRGKVNSLSHVACDLFFNYGIIVSSETLDGDFAFQNPNSDFHYTTHNENLLDEKQEFLRHGLMECIRRGYTGEFFFMTGSLNGMLDRQSCQKTNQLIYNGKAIIEFEVDA